MFQDAGETPETADIGRYAATGDNAPTIDSIDLCGLASERGTDGNAAVGRRAAWQSRGVTAEVSGHIINRRSPGLRGHPSGDSTHLRGSGRPRGECSRVRRVRGHRTSPGCRYFPERPLRGPLAGTPAPGSNKMRDYGTGKHIKLRCGPCAIGYTHFTRRVSTAEKKSTKNYA